MKLCLVINKLKINISSKCFCDKNCVLLQKVRFCDEFNFIHKKTWPLAMRSPKSKNLQQKLSCYKKYDCKKI